MGTVKHQTEIKNTSDGSDTLYLADIDEAYHSTHGAIQESEHIFINAGLKCCTKKEISILEIGFGTGLNAFLTYLTANGNLNLKIHYTALEKFPVEPKLAMHLNYPEIKGEGHIFSQLHTCEWGKIIKITENFSIEKIKTDFTEYTHRKKYDLIYFDAFSPEKQPEMWTEELFSRIAEHCNDGTILVTYCAKGSVKRAMQFAGFSVEKLQGPPGKRHILRASKLNS